MSEKMLAGAAETVITPPVGTELAGYFHTRVSDGVISDLKAKAIVAGEGDDRVAIIACDLITIVGEITAKARAIIEKATGIRGERVLICATHTHTGPDLRDGSIAAVNHEWLAKLPELIADAAIKAANNQRECVALMGKDHEEGLAFNRRFRYRDGTEQFGTGGAAGVVGSAGPTDPEFGVIKFATDENAAPFALICNYSVHIDVTSGNKISADFPAIMTDVLRGVYGEELIVLYVQGACGNINHCPYLMDRPWPYKGHEKSVQMGRTFAGKALAISEKALPSEDSTVDAMQTVLDVAKYPWDDVVEKNVEISRTASEPKPGGFHERMLAKAAEYDPTGTIPREIQSIRIGDAVFCSAPGELFVEWGLEIKKWSPFKYTFVAELANDSVGYIPTFEAFRRGGYEATPIVSVISTPALGQMIADTNFVHLQQMKQKNDERQTE